MIRGLLTAFVVLLALALPAVAQGAPGLVVGAVEDDVRVSSAVEAEAKMKLLRLSGYRSVRITSFWNPGQKQPTENELDILRNVAEAADRHNVRVFTQVMHPGSRTTPLTDEARADFASSTAALVRSVPGIRDVIVGNEPNLNRFWLPQFDESGASVAPAAYLTLLAQTYDALKAVSPSVRVYGGAISPRGSDRPGGIRPTHSPTRFIQELGIAYRASGRTTPVMDALAIHPYTDNSSQPPTTAHPLTTTVAIAEATQAAYYRQALALAFCQPTVEGMLLFLSRDERARAAWQSGVYYVDGSAKTSLARVTESLDRATGGSIARCPDLQLPVRASLLRFGKRSAAKRGVFRTTFRCDLDCVYQVRLENAVTHATKLGRKGRAEVGETVQVDLGTRRLRAGT